MTERSSFKSWVIFGIATIFYLYELTLRVAPSVMTDDLMVKFDATSTMLGVLVSFYYYAYTILQLPCGVILDKMGPRNLLGISAFLCVIGSLLFAYADKIHIAQIGRFLIGAGSACAFISCLQIAAGLFPKKHFVILAGVTNMMGTLGGLLGGPPVARLVNNIGWENTTYWLSAVGFFIFLLVYIFIPKDTLRVDRSTVRETSVISTVLRLLKKSQVVLPGIIAGFMYLPIDAFAELWVVPFFMTKYGVNNELASFASAIIFVGVAIGSVVLAMLARKFRSYMKTIRLASLLASCLFVYLVFSHYGIYVSFVIVFFIGILTGAQPINFVCAKNNTSSEISGTTMAMTNCIVMLVGSLFQPFLGALLDYFWNGTIGTNGVRVYDISCYRYTILVIPIFLLIAYFISLFVKETIQLEDA